MPSVLTMLSVLQSAFDRVRKSGLKLRLEKCKSMHTKDKYLGSTSHLHSSFHPRTKWTLYATSFLQTHSKNYNNSLVLQTDLLFPTMSSWLVLSMKSNLPSTRHPSCSSRAGIILISRHSTMSKQLSLRWKWHSPILISRNSLSSDTALATHTLVRF